MPSTKTNASTTKGFLDQEKYTAELSSGQLVVGVCALIVFGLACFMVGVIVGKFQPSERLQTAQNAPGAAGTGNATRPGTSTNREPMAPSTPPKSNFPALGTGSGSQRPSNARTPAVTEPKPTEPEPQPPNIVRVPPPETPKDDATQSGSGVSPLSVPPREIPKDDADATREGPRLVPFPELSSTPSTSPPAVTETKPSDEAGSKPPDAEPATEKPTPPELKPLEVADEAPPVSTPPQSAPIPAEPAKTEPAKAEPPAAPEGKFSVQVAALTRRDGADRAKREAETKTGLPVEIGTSASGKLTLVWVGRYPTEAEAEKARRLLEKDFGYAKCFVVNRQP